MGKFTNPLNKIKIASPCGANWNEMRGDDRKRYCGECKLNVYNLSGMTQTEAESFLINSEGRVCVKFYRRADGSILTKDCPVGWQAFKKKTSRAAKAFISICAGIFGGVFAFNQFQPNQNVESENSIKVSTINPNEQPNTIEDFENIPSLPVDQTPASTDASKNDIGVLGMILLNDPPKKPVNQKKKHRR